MDNVSMYRINLKSNENMTIIEVIEPLRAMNVLRLSTGGSLFFEGI